MSGQNKRALTAAFAPQAKERRATKKKADTLVRNRQTNRKKSHGETKRGRQAKKKVLARTNSKIVLIQDSNHSLFKVLLRRRLEPKDNRLDAALLHGMVEKSLLQVFDAADFPIEDRPNFVSRVLDDIFSRKREVKIPKIPTVPPALWHKDKDSNDTPPVFIKRHYSPWLRADGSGLNRSHIRQLDEQLYTALYNWQKKNTMPEDCPLPTKSEAITLELARRDQSSAHDSMNDYWRRQNRRRATQRDM